MYPVTSFPVPCDYIVSQRKKQVILYFDNKHLIACPFWRYIFKGRDCMETAWSDQKAFWGKYTGNL